MVKRLKDIFSDSGIQSIVEPGHFVKYFYSYSDVFNSLRTDQQQKLSDTYNLLCSDQSDISIFANQFNDMMYLVHLAISMYGHPSRSSAKQFQSDALSSGLYELLAPMVSRKGNFIIDNEVSCYVKSFPDGKRKLKRVDTCIYVIIKHNNKKIRIPIWGSESKRYIDGTMYESAWATKKRWETSVPTARYVGVQENFTSQNHNDDPDELTLYTLREQPRNTPEEKSMNLGNDFSAVVLQNILADASAHLDKIKLDGFVHYRISGVDYKRGIT